MTDASDNRPPKRRSRAVYVVLGLLSLVGAGVFVWLGFFQTYHLIEVDPGKVYRDGNRSVREFRNALRVAKPKTVVAVIDDEEFNQPEFVGARELCQSRGIEWIRIPVKAGKFPLPEQFRQFISIATDPAKQPVLFHDDEGIRRAGMMMAAYQMSALGYDRARAKADIHAFGHSDRTIDDVRRFIDAYDPKFGLSADLNATVATTTSATTHPAAAGE